VRGPSHVVRVGPTSALAPAEACALLDGIDATTPIGLRNRALLGLMVYSFARIGAAVGMRVEDVFSQRRRLWVRLREKGGRAHAMLCHHSLEAYLHAYLDGTGIADDPKGPPFRTVGAAPTASPTPRRRPTPTRWCGGVRRRPDPDPDRQPQLPGNRDHRLTGNGGTLEWVAVMANHASTRTTQLYDWRANYVSLDEVERIGI